MLVWTVRFVVVVEIVVNTAVTDFVCGFNDLVDIVGNFVNFTIGGIDGLKAFL